MSVDRPHDVALEIAVWEALQRVIDPEPGISLLDLGLVQSVTVADGRAIIELALTTPFCPLVDVMEHRDCGRKRVLGARASPPACRDCGRKRILGARASPPACGDC